MSFNEALKIHGYVFADESSSNEDSKSVLDEDYYKWKPSPVPVRKSKRRIVKIKANSESTSNGTNEQGSFSNEVPSVSMQNNNDNLSTPSGVQEPKSKPELILDPAKNHELNHRQLQEEPQQSTSSASSSHEPSLQTSQTGANIAKKEAQDVPANSFVFEDRLFVDVVKSSQSNWQLANESKRKPFIRQPNRSTAGSNNQIRSTDQQHFVIQTANMNCPKWQANHNTIRRQSSGSHTGRKTRLIFTVENEINQQQRQISNQSNEASTSPNQPQSVPHHPKRHSNQNPIRRQLAEVPVASQPQRNARESATSENAQREMHRQQVTTQRENGTQINSENSSGCCGAFWSYICCKSNENYSRF